MQECSLSFSLQLGEQLRQLVPMCGLTVLDLEVDGTCLRFSPLMTAAGKAITTLPLWLRQKLLMASSQMTGPPL